MTCQRFDWKGFIKMVLVIAVPIALQNLLTTTASMVDTMMIAPLGENTVGAIGLCAQYTTLMGGCYWGFQGGGALFLAQYWGAKDEKGLTRAYGMMMLCMMTVGTLFALFAVCFPQKVMGLYTDKSSIQVIGVQYLRIVGFAYPMQILSMAVSTLLRTTERVRFPLYASIASVLTNIALNYLLIGGRLGFPRLGVRGAAIATVCAAAVNLIMLYVFALASRFPYLFRVREHFRWPKSFVREYFVKSFPILCNEVLIGIGGMVINMVLGRQSEPAIAAVAVFRVLEGLVIGFFMGFSNAGSLLVGKCVGAGEHDTAYERAWRLVYLCGGTIAMICLSVVALHKPILTAMSLTGESYSIGTGLVCIYSAIGVIRMMNWVQNDTYRSAGDAAFGTILEIVFMYCMLIPMVLLSGLKWKWPILAVFCCCYIDEPIRFVLMQIHMFSGKWVKPVTDIGRAALPAFRAKHGHRDHNRTEETV